MGLLSKSKPASQPSPTQPTNTNAPTFQPNRHFSISSPSALATSCRILDQSAPQTSYIVISKDHWYSKDYTITSPTALGPSEVAKWRPAWTYSATSTLEFPPDSPYSAHPIKVSTDSIWAFKFREKFVCGGVTYFWRGEGLFSGDAMGLWRVWGEGQEVMVARFEGRGWRGTLSVDERGVGALVAVLTCLVCLRKKDQKRRDEKGG
jgi:hypothetical protein